MRGSYPNGPREELESLASESSEDHDTVPPMTDLETRHLGDLGETVYVTGAAAHTYSDATGLRPEAARRELTLWLLGARQTHLAVGDHPEAWRRRSRSWGWDVTARVVHEDGLAVVTSVLVRRYGPPGGRGR